MKPKQILPVIALVLILGPAASRVLLKPEPPPPVATVRPPEPELPAPPASAQDWFAQIKPRCTPADVRLATDLRPPPDGVEGTGYKAACFALARQVPTARAFLLGLPRDEQVVGASVVYDVAQQLASENRHDIAGPLMELVLEFWPDHYLALFEAGKARYVSGDLHAAQGLLGRFLEVYVGDDSLVANARRMMGGTAES
jgi:hypothetical protein